jgi:hypothetical protein
MSLVEKFNNKNMKTLRLIPFILLCVLAAGCSMFGANPSAPTKFETVIFDTKTNFVEKVVLKTNVVNEVVVQTIYVTNEVGVIVSKTNEVTIPKYDLITVTQEVAQYTLTPSTNTIADVKLIGEVVNTFAPGIGTIFAGIALGVIGMFGKMRSTKKTGMVLAQDIETLREFIKTLPDGAKYDAVIVEYLQTHQEETNTAKTVLQLLEKYVSNTQAKGAVQELKAALDSATKV